MDPIDFPMERENISWFKGKALPFNLVYYCWLASLVAQWQRMHLPMQESQETRVRLLGREDPVEQHSPVFSLRKFQGQRSLVGNSRKESDMTEELNNCCWQMTCGIPSPQYSCVRLTSGNSHSSDVVQARGLINPIYLQPVKTNSFVVERFLEHSVQFSSVAQSWPTLCDPMNRSTPGLPVHHQLPEFTQIHVHWVSDAIQPSHPLSSPSPPALNLAQHQGLFQWVSSSHQVAKVLEFQLQHQSFQWTPRTDL